MAKSNFIVRGGADFSAIKNEIDKTQKKFKGFKANLSSGLKSFSKLTGIALGAKALYDFGKASIEVASDLTEVQNVVDVTFGHMANDVNEFASTALKQYGLSELAAKQYTSTMGAMLKSSGITGEAVKDMSIEITKLTADMASFYNLSGDEAFRKIRSGISGETEPLKQLGINMSVANMEAYAMSQGINKAWKEMTQAEQTMLRYNYLLSVTGDAQGDFARESGTWANQVKILKEQWQEFMGLIGKALIEILLPVVRFLNKALELLIKIAKAIGKIYTIVTGKEVAVETNTNIGDSAEFAASSEEDLAKGIDKAAKAAKGALAPFDELNILQNNLGSGGTGGGIDGLGGLNGLKTDLGLNKVGDSIADGFREAREEADKFFIWFDNRWRGLKDALMIPIQVPAPIFAEIPSPIYEPNWGLELPPLQKPVFQPIPNPVYQPNWGLDVPGIPAPVFPSIPNPVYQPNWNLVPPPVPVVEIPAIDYTEYQLSLEEIKIKTSETYQETKTNIIEYINGLRERQAELWSSIREDTEMEMGRISTGLVKAWETNESNFDIHKENMGVIAAAVSAALVSNINEGLSKLGINTNNTILTTQDNWQTWGSNLTAIVIETAKGFSSNMAEGFKTTATNTIEFANSSLQNLKSWGEGVLAISAEAGRGLVNNIVNSLKTAFDNIAEFAKTTGERVSGWFNANKRVITTTAIAAGVVVGAGALALAAPAVIPYAGAALGGLATIPALATGGITNGPMIAMIGDNPGGREVVSPLDTLQDMLVSAVGTAMIQHEQFNSGNREPIVMQVILEGREIAKAVYDPLEDEKSRRGSPIIESI